MKEFSSRVAIVTGGNRGIGRATALAFSREEAAVVVVGRSAEANQAVVEEIQAAGGQACGYALDVADAAAAEAMVREVRERYGRIDILVNNAGICQWKVPFEELTDEGWDTTLSVNVKGIVHSVRPLIPIFKEQQYGKIVNISSMAGQMGSIFTTADYAASKAAVLNMTMTLAKALAPYQVNVNAVAPGFIHTHMTEAISVKTSSIPLGRVGEPEDVAEAVLFLASDRARYITGATIDVNGGWFMR